LVVVLCELVVRHTRRTSPTRRVAVERFDHPDTGAPLAPGILLGAVVARHKAALDEVQRDRLADLLALIAQGERMPFRALRYRVQTDRVGLDRSVHRLVMRGEAPVADIDAHGPGTPQVVGALMALASLRGQGRRAGVRLVRSACEMEWTRGSDVARRLMSEADVRVLTQRERPAATPEEEAALRTLGFGLWERPTRAEVVAAFRRLVRAVHPDHGAESLGAGLRMAALASARSLLLDSGAE